MKTNVLKKRLALLLVVAMVMAMISGCSSPKKSSELSGSTTGNASEAKTLKISHNQAEKHPVHMALLSFKEKVEEQSNGSIKVDIYPNGQLADDATGIDQVKLGSIQGALLMCAPGTYISGGTAYGSIEEIPFLFADAIQARAAYDGEFGDAIIADAESHGLKVINFWENGFRNITNNTRPIVVPKDMTGIKFRVASSEIRKITFESLGASAIVMAFGELFTGLQQGTVDGQENPLSIIETAQFYEVQKYLSLSRHIYNTATFIVNPGFWNSLTDEEKNIVQSAADESRDYMRQLNDEFETTAIDRLKSHGMEINEIDTNSFKEEVQPAWDYFKEQYGDEATKLINLAIGK